MKCVIPCAGESSRMSHVPKHLIQIKGKPLLLHIIDMWKDHVDGFVFVLKRSATYLWEYLPKNSIVVFQDEPKGLADAILQAEGCIDGRFIVNLSDCVLSGKFADKKFELGIGVWKVVNEEYWKSYAVQTNADGLVLKVIEKPKSIVGYCGMGTYFLDTRVFDYIRKAAVSPSGGDFTEVLQGMIDAGEKITPVWFEGKYINVTYPEDIEKAEAILK